MLSHRPLHSQMWRVTQVHVLMVVRALLHWMDTDVCALLDSLGSTVEQVSHIYTLSEGLFT